MGLVIDADVLIEFERGDLNIETLIQGREAEEFFLSVITASELLHGVWRANKPHVQTKRAAYVEAILAHFSILGIDLPIARTHAQLWASLASKGTMIGLHDSWLAATCIAYGHTLITSNTREFGRVKGLTVERWSKRK